MNRKNALIWAGYGIYSLLAFLIFGYIRFPAQDILALLLQEVNGRLGSFYLAAKEITPVLPPGLRLGTGFIARRESPQAALFQFKELTLQPRLFSDKHAPPLAFTAQAVAYGGKLTGKAAIAQQETLDGKYFLSGSGMNLAALTPLQEALGRKIAGTIAAEFNFTGIPLRLADGTGEGRIEMKAGMIGLLQPVLGISELAYDELTIGFQLQSRTLEITECTMKGNLLNGTISGKILTAEPFITSTLALKGNLTLHDKTLTAGGAVAQVLKSRLRDGKLFFNVTGTVAEPFFEPQ